MSNDPFGLGLTPEMFLGKPLLHVGMNIIVQNMLEGKVIGVFQCSAGDALMMGSKKTHQLILGDAFIRPRLALHSDEFRGYGISSLIKEAFVETDKWEILFERGK